LTTNIQLLRSSVAQKRPNPASLLDGQAAVNINVAEPGLFFKGSDGTLLKVGPTAITTNGLAPNASASGQVGNSIGEMWLDGRAAFATPVAKIYNGTQWLTTSGFTVDNSTGNFSLTKRLTVSTLVADGSGANGYIKVPSLDNAQSPESTVSSIGAIYFNTATNKFRGRNNTGWTDIGSGNLTDLTVSNDATIDGNLIVGGDTILGNDCGADTLIVNAVASLTCNTTIGSSSSNTLTVPALSDFQSNVRISSQADLRFHSGAVGSSGYVGFQAPSSLTGATIWTLPATDGSSGQVLTTNGTGVLSWGSGGGGGGGGASITVSDTAPTLPAPTSGNLWYNSAAGRLYVYYVDPSSTNQWVDVSPVSAGVTNIKILDDVSASFDGVLDTFPLTVSSVAFIPVNAQQLLVVVNDVYQVPGTDYTISGSNIVFTTPPTSGQSFSAIALGAAVTQNTVADGAISTAKIQTGAVTAAKLSIDGNVSPTADNTYNLGSPTFRFANIYTGDLHLKNDKGDWTMVEAEEYLTLRNNKTGKVYKLVMEEI
jgi:hypothetical protein